MKTNRSAAVGAFLLRIALGVVFVAHGALKYFILGLPQTAEFFASHGFPAWTAYPVFAVEMIGGIMLLIGIATRWAAVVLIPVSLGALVVHWPNGWYFASPNGGWEYAAFLTAALSVQAIIGNGAFSLQAVFARSTRPKRFAAHQPMPPPREGTAT